MLARARLCLVASVALTAASLGGEGSARANGRFPASSAVIFSPAGGDDAHVMVRTTFGLVVTRDGGKTWGWICERAIGFSGPEDPSYVVTRSGAIVAGLFDGLRVSRDGGCSWSPVKTDATVFVDVTMRADGAVVALASSYDRHGDGGSLYKTQLWVSTDDARSFQSLGPRFDPTLLGETVEVAPSDPSRVYVSAVRGEDAGRQGVLLVSTDGGKHFVERRAALEPKELAPFIAAVDPKRADRIYVRTSASPENPTRLLVSDDAGRSFRRLVSAKGPLLGFSLSADGATVRAGGPDDGLFTGAADARELSLAPVDASAPKLKVQCLGQAPHGDDLWACSSEASGFVAGTSRDGGGSFEPRLHLRDITGPLACAADSAVARECGVDWQKLTNDLGLSPPAPGPAPPAVTPSPPPAVQRDTNVGWLALAAIIAAAALFFRARARKK